VGDDRSTCIIETPAPYTGAFIDASATISNITFRQTPTTITRPDENGNDHDYDTPKASGIVVESGEPTLTDITVSSFETGLEAANVSLTVSNCSFVGNVYGSVLPASALD
jgi:hypothetical protein